jgi:Ca2+-binding RTX toxin-like protein
LPGNGSPEVKGDYFVLAVADYKDEIKERDGNVFNEDNAVALTGGYLASDGVLLVHGTPQADEIKVVANTVSAKLGGKQFSYAFAASKGVTIRAHAGDDVLQGGPGNDTLIGAAGNDDYLFGSGAIGADVLIETTGVDRLDFLTRNTPVEVSLATSTAQKIELGGKGASTITLGSATAFEELFGTSFNDVLRGNSLANKIDGRAGDDTLWGRDGGDTLIGGAGVDKVYGEEGNDWLLGGMGNDILDGMTGDDTIQFEPQSGNDEIREASGTDTLDFSKMTVRELP